MQEADIMRRLMKLATNMGARLFRNNTAQSWVGKAQQFQKRTTYLKFTFEAGDVLIRQGRPLHAGLCVGSSDTIGWTPITITQAMVGDRIAVFTAVEVKTDKGRATAEQKQFLSVVQAAGGYAGIARNDQDLTMILCPDLSLAPSVDKNTMVRNGENVPFDAVCSSLE